MADCKGGGNDDSRGLNTDTCRSCRGCQSLAQSAIAPDFPHLHLAASLLSVFSSPIYMIQTQVNQHTMIQIYPFTSSAHQTNGPPTSVLFPATTGKFKTRAIPLCCPAFSSLGSYSFTAAVAGWLKEMASDEHHDSFTLGKHSAYRPRRDLRQGCMLNQ